MLKLGFGRQNDYKILCLGSHCDDIEIGCGGTILKLIESYKNSVFHWVVFSSNQTRIDESCESANMFLKDANSKNIVFRDFRDGFFPTSRIEIKEYFEELKCNFSPDLILTHYRNDLHQDHRLISELTWNTFRNHLILEYEIPKYDGDLGSPNFFVHLDKYKCIRKVQYIINCFKSQKEKHWFEEETFFAMLRIRGLESNSPSKYAEAFYCRKTVFD